MSKQRNTYITRVIQAAFVATCLATVAMAQHANTVVPVTFLKTVNVRHANVGDVVLAQTMQRVNLDGESVPRGSIISAHVVEASSGGGMATLSLKFDTLRTQRGTVRLSATVRALANAREAEEAETPRQYAENDPFPSRVLIGGGYYVPPSKNVVLDNADGTKTIGHVNREGVFGPMQAGADAESSSGECVATATSQSLGIFSPLACGTYGYESTHLLHRAASDGLVMVSSRAQLNLYAKSAALLIVTLSD